jgi:transcription antitermination factor NusG
MEAEPTNADNSGEEHVRMQSLQAQKPSTPVPDVHESRSPVTELERLYDTPHWFAVYTCTNREKLVASHFASRGIEHFLPLFESVREWSDRRVKLEMPLFPGYLFVYSDLRRRLPILTVPGVVNLVSFAGQPIPLPPDVVPTLREGIKRISAEPYPYLTVGTRVSICSGPLKGLNGILLRRKSGPRVVVSIDAIERSFLADVAADDLVPLGKTRAEAMRANLSCSN